MSEKSSLVSLKTAFIMLAREVVRERIPSILLDIYEVEKLSEIMLSIELYKKVVKTRMQVN